MGVCRNFSRRGKSTYWLSFSGCWQCSANRRIHTNVQCYGNSCIHCFPCKKLYTEQMFVL